MNKDLKSYILTIPNVLPADEYYEVLDYCESTNDFERREKSYDIVDTFHQKGKRFDVNLESGRIHDLVRKAFIFGLNESLNYYNHLIPKMYNMVSGYWLLKYVEGDFLTMHTDFQAEAGSITMTYNINDNYEGGELVFWDDYVLPNQKNTIHVFPSCFLYPHEIKPIKKGDRYAAITWFGYERGDRKI
mgnify:CR=1 FL=1